MADEVKWRWRWGGGHSPALGNFHHGPLLPVGCQLTSSAASVGWLVKTAQHGGKTLSPGPLSPVPTPWHRKWEAGFLKPLGLGWVQFRQIHDAPFPATMKFQQPVMRISEEHRGAEGGVQLDCHTHLANTFASKCYFVLRYDFSNRADNGRLKLWTRTAIPFLNLCPICGRTQAWLW